MAVAAFCGALAAVDGHLRAVPLTLAVAVLAAACWRARRRLRPELLCLGVALLAAALGQRSVDGLDAPLTTGPVHTEVTLVTDPEPDGRGGVTVDVRLGGRRVRGAARISAAGALDDRLAGERVTVIGRVRDLGPRDAWLRPRHIAGRLTIETVTGWRTGGPASRLANDLRRTLARGAEALPERQRSLLAGITLGDDRAQPADMADAFQAAGLTHLLAVSGQNVAFVMVIAAPLLTRLRFGSRLAATLGVLAMFALVTRAEPSVLRATAMAAVAAVGTATGRPASSVRTLALGATAMLLIDPLLATSLGFRLSLAGATGIVVGAGRIEDLLPGPRWLAVPLSVTVAAQAAVSPLLVAAFGSVPLASLPANMLAAPAAGPVMVWGLTGGLAAGVLGGVPAGLLHLPTRAMLAWLEVVAAAAVRWPLGDLRAAHLAGLTVAAVLLAVARAGVGRHLRPVAGSALRLAGGCLLAGVVVASVAPVRGSATSPLEQPLGLGATLWRAGGATLVELDGRARDDAVLRGLRRDGVDRLDVVVARTSSQAVADVVATVRRRWPAVLVLVPGPDASGPGQAVASIASIPGSHAPRRGTTFDVGGLRVTVAGNTADRLDVLVAPRPPPSGDSGAGGPPGGRSGHAGPSGAPAALGPRRFARAWPRSALGPPLARAAPPTGEPVRRSRRPCPVRHSGPPGPWRLPEFHVGSEVSGAGPGPAGLVSRGHGAAGIWRLSDGVVLVRDARQLPIDSHLGRRGRSERAIRKDVEPDGWRGVRRQTLRNRAEPDLGQADRSPAGQDLSSAIVPVPSPSPVVHIEAALDLDGGAIDLATRVLVAGVVPVPRFGREAEVVATATALVSVGADLVDVSLSPRLVGPAVRAVRVPVAARVDAVEAVAAAGRAGAAVVLVPVALLPGVAHVAEAETAPAAAGSGHGGGRATIVALVDDLAGVAEARAAAGEAGVPLAFDSSRWSAADAIAREAAAVAEGCRILRTTDVRRSRRVAEVMAAILEARRPPAGAPNDRHEGTP